MSKNEPMPERRTVLIASTSWWAFPARLAMGFAAVGHSVEAICPAHHPLMKTKSVRRCHPYRALQPLRSLEQAISRANPVLIVPCDDRVVLHLHQLFARMKASGAPMADLIERSLGQSAGFQIADERSEFIKLAREEGILAPEMFPVRTAEELSAALATVGLPAIMKTDGTWGGLGVTVARTREQAALALRRMSSPLDAARAMKRLIVHRDLFSLPAWFHRTRPLVNVQKFIEGRPANIAVVCWAGEVLASISVEVLNARGELGNSTIVRVIENRQMLETAKRLARRMGLSGFCGFDFVIENGTNNAHVIEINPRSTPLSHLAMGENRDLISALSARICGLPQPVTDPVTLNDVIVFFPQAWTNDPSNKFLRNGYHDVPWEEADLVQELIKEPWPDRSILAQLLAWTRESATVSHTFVSMEDSAGAVGTPALYRAVVEPDQERHPTEQRN